MKNRKNSKKLRSLSADQVDYVMEAFSAAVERAGGRTSRDCQVAATLREQISAQAMGAIKIAALITLLLLAGCATRRKELVPVPLPMPPPLSQSFLRSQKVLPMKALEPCLLRWDDCGPQPEGVIYRVYSTTDLVKWDLCGETDTHIFQISFDRPFLFFGVSAFCDGVESLMGGKECR